MRDDSGSQRVFRGRDELQRDPLRQLVREIARLFQVWCLIIRPAKFVELIELDFPGKGVRRRRIYRSGGYRE